MENNQWLKMLKYQQELHHFSRKLLLAEKDHTLTVSEIELLSWLYLNPENSTPLSLVQETGMKKEAVSRCLKKLIDKQFINKEQHPEDKRSIILAITEKGMEELNANYIAMLKPMYELKRLMDEDFDVLFNGIVEANRCLDIIKRG